MSVLVQLNNYTNFIRHWETKFESPDYVDSMKRWMHSYWSMSFVYAFAYVILIFAGRLYMNNRPKYELRGLLFAWNLILTLFSATGTIRVIPQLWYNVVYKGLDYSICDNSFAYGFTGFWSYAFIMSKLPELVDTAFIVLRKQPLIFLHWYHHATVLVYCWYSYHDFSASGMWFMAMNYCVHTLMYGYYALKALRFKLPRQLSQLITTLQLVQMIVGCFVNYRAYLNKQMKQACAISDENIKYSFIMYFSYFMLFFHFFVNAYYYKAARTDSGKCTAKKAVNSVTISGEKQNGISENYGVVNGCHDINHNITYGKKSN